TESVSSRSSVLGRSRMIFAPEQKTATGERPSSSRSADSSSGRPRWTPPMPPVAIKRIPAIAATRIVAATVVAPTEPCATAVPRSRELTLTDAAATRSSPARAHPMFGGLDRGRAAQPRGAERGSECVAGAGSVDRRHRRRRDRPAEDAASGRAQLQHRYLREVLQRNPEGRGLALRREEDLGRQ